MSYLAPSTSSFQSIERVSQGAVSSESQQQNPHTTSIHILDDDSLLNIFYLYRPFLLGEDHNDDDFRIEGGGQWAGERWWYRLAHVCQRWRNLILGSASYLGLYLACTHGTPVADMLVHSPPLPLVIDYFDHGDITEEDEEAIILALEQRDRVRRIRFGIPIIKLQRLIMTIDGEYPILEYLILGAPTEKKSTILTLPDTLQTPNLRHLTIDCSIPIPIRSPLLGSTAGLVILQLCLYHTSTYFQPTALLQWVSLMPQLEILQIFFAVSNVERQPMDTPFTTHVTLPNLRSFVLRTVNAYSEAVVSRITAPRLEDLQFCFHKQVEQFMFSVPQLLQFLGRTENLSGRFDRAQFQFTSKQVFVGVYLPKAKTPAFSINVDCLHLDWQVSSVAQIFNAFSQIFSAVEHLNLEDHRQSCEEHNGVDRTEWRKLLRSFTNVKTLDVNGRLVTELSRCLHSEDGEHPLELLPELQELICYWHWNSRIYPFTSFINARKYAGRPVILVID